VLHVYTCTCMKCLKSSNWYLLKRKSALRWSYYTSAQGVSCLFVCWLLLCKKHLSLFYSNTEIKISISIKNIFLYFVLKSNTVILIYFFVNFFCEYSISRFQKLIFESIQQKYMFQNYLHIICSPLSFLV
jgi:hypothetical protein